MPKTSHSSSFAGSVLEMFPQFSWI